MHQQEPELPLPVDRLLRPTEGDVSAFGLWTGILLGLGGLLFTIWTFAPWHLGEKIASSLATVATLGLVLVLLVSRRILRQARLYNEAHGQYSQLRNEYRALQQSNASLEDMITDLRNDQNVRADAMVVLNRALQDRNEKIQALSKIVQVLTVEFDRFLSTNVVQINERGKLCLVLEKKAISSTANHAEELAVDTREEFFCVSMVRGQAVGVFVFVRTTDVGHVIVEDKIIDTQWEQTIRERALSASPVQLDIVAYRLRRRE